VRTVISPAKNYENSLKRALLQRKKLHWPRLIWPTRYVYLSATLRETIAALWIVSFKERFNSQISSHASFQFHTKKRRNQRHCV